MRAHTASLWGSGKAFWTSVIKQQELDLLNLVEKHRGAMYTDASGKPKRETNLYSVPSEDERKERKQQDKEGQYSFGHQHNIDVLAGVAQLDEIDPRCEGTNVYKTGKKDFLGKKEYWIWKTTDYESTRKHLDRRFNSLKEANSQAFARIEREGEKYIKEIVALKNMQAKEATQVFYASRNPGDINYIDPASIDYEDDYGILQERFVKKQEPERKYEARKESERERKEQFYAVLDAVGEVQEQDGLPF